MALTAIFQQARKGVRRDTNRSLVASSTFILMYSSVHVNRNEHLSLVVVVMFLGNISTRSYKIRLILIYINIYELVAVSETLHLSEQNSYQNRRIIYTIKYEYNNTEC